MTLDSEPVLAWAQPPVLSDLAQAVRRSSGKIRIAVRMPERTLPQWRISAQPCPTEQALVQALAAQSGCLNCHTANYLTELLPNLDLWLLPPAAAARISDFFPAPVQWQDKSVVQQTARSLKPWQIEPEPHAPEHVLIIGAGIAGAATAYELARRGVHVSVLEAADDCARTASGNKQGLLYAKISPHPTAQTELLLSGYGYTRRLLEKLLPQSENWQGCGVLHLDHNDAERERNRRLAEQDWHRHLYRAVSRAQASELAGIELPESGLYWPQGAWLHPPALVHALLAQPNISLHTATPLLHAEYDGSRWLAHTPKGIFSGSHIVFCTGADSPKLPVIGQLPLRQIRGQTSLAAATPASSRLKTALSAASYVSPAFNGTHCFGASFIPNDGGSDWRAEEDQANRRALAELAPALFHALDGYTSNPHSAAQRGHAAVRCDSYDHLPVVGALGDSTAMRRIYAKLALDKNYRLNTPCPYLPQAYINTAHSSRGLATAPICAAQLAAQICGDASPFSEALRTALQPNRLIVRNIVHND